MRIKLFAGVALDTAARRRIATLAQRVQARGLEARFESPAKYHLTLAFLGWVERFQLEEIRSTIERCATLGGPFQLRLDRLGAFPHERRPRVVWIGARHQPAAFQALAGALRTSYEALGFKFTDDAVAHVTIARVKEPRVPLPTISVFAPVAITVERLTLFQSVAAVGTTRYEERAAVRLSVT